MSFHLCFQAAYRLQVLWKSSDWTFNQNLFPVSKSHLTPLCCPLWSWFCAFFLWPFSVALHLLLLQEYLVQGCHCFKKDPGSFCVYHYGEAVHSRTMVSLSCGSENTGADCPHLSSGLVFLEHLLVLRLCTAQYWLWVLSLCTWLVQTDVLVKSQIVFGQNKSFAVFGVTGPIHLRNVSCPFSGSFSEMQRLSKGC